MRTTRYALYLVCALILDFFVENMDRKSTGRPISSGNAHTKKAIMPYFADEQVYDMVTMLQPNWGRLSLFLTILLMIAFKLRL